ncbi:MAG: hypothetical protein WC708_18530, partial [Lentisphaeria bacterium]
MFAAVPHAAAIDGVGVDDHVLAFTADPDGPALAGGAGNGVADNGDVAVAVVALEFAAVGIGQPDARAHPPAFLGVGLADRIIIGHRVAGDGDVAAGEEQGDAAVLAAAHVIAGDDRILTPFQVKPDIRGAIDHVVGQDNVAAAGGPDGPSAAIFDVVAGDNNVRGVLELPVVHAPDFDAMHTGVDDPIAGDAQMVGKHGINGQADLGELAIGQGDVV